MSDWTDIPGFEGWYQVHPEGRVRSVDRVVKGAFYKGKELKVFRVAGRYRYASVTLSKSGVMRPYTVHVLVALTFLGERPFEGAQVRHLDGDWQNPKLSNLAYGTALENSADTVLHGTRINGIKNHQAKLVPEQIFSIKQFKGRGYTNVSIGQMFGISPGHVSRIINNRRWQHLLEDIEL